jgi:hypothetical protein
MIPSPYGKQSSLGADYYIVKLWEVASGKERRRYQGHRFHVLTLAFSPDGRRLASGSLDNTALLWDETGLSTEQQSSGTTLSPEAMAALWSDLASDDATRAYQAIWSLAAAESAAAFLRGRLRPVAAPAPQHLAKLIGDLDSDRFAVRERAAQELDRLGELAEPALRETLAGNPSLEVRQRLTHLLEKRTALVTDSERLRALRASEVLEHNGTPEARQVLETLAQGAPQARLTQEAKASLERLAQRPAVTR